MKQRRHLGRRPLAAVHPDADKEARDDLNDEYVILANSREPKLGITDWTITTATDQTAEIGTAMVTTEESNTRHTRNGTDTNSNLY